MLQATVPREETEDRGNGYASALNSLKTYLAEVSKHSLLKRQEETEVAEKAHRHKDVDARSKLITSNLRLVVKIALEYYRPHHDLLDLIQEGNEGLVRAARRYNPYKGTRFSTYSSFWIRAYILKHIMDSWSLVKVGTTQNQRRLFYRLGKEKKKLAAEGAVPLPGLVADALGVSTQEVESMEKRLSGHDVSLDSPLHDEGDDTLMDMIATGENIEETVAEREKAEILEQKVAQFRQALTEKELSIFDRRIMSEEPATLQEIAKQYGISRERVRQLERRVVGKFSERFKLEMKAFDL